MLIRARYCWLIPYEFARLDKYGVFEPLQGGGFPPQTLPIPSFSIIITTRWSKYAPGPGVAEADGVLAPAARRTALASTDTRRIDASSNPAGLVRTLLTIMENIPAGGQIRAERCGQSGD